MNLVGAFLAAVQLASPFADHMVLQRDKPVPVWGGGAPGESVAVAFAGQRLEAKVGGDGRWRVDLAPMQACRNGRTLKAGDVEIKDILVGEVWLCAGQSNMGVPLCGSVRCGDRQGRLIAQMTHRPLIRYVSTPSGTWDFSEHKAIDSRLAWRAATPDNLMNHGFSATALYFAFDVEREIDVPIGLVGVYRGSTCIDSWTPPEGTRTRPDLRDIAEWKYISKEKWTDADAKGPINRPDLQPAAYWNTVVAPWTPFACRGMLWYQGEHDSRPGRYERYCSKLHALYNGWRARFENPDMSFYYVQLCSWGGNIAPMQETMAQFERECPNAAMAVINDIGNNHDIHPNEKALVGHRLALHALRRDYGFKEIRDNSPSVESWRVASNTFEIVFKDCKSLYVYRKDWKFDLPFEIAGADGVFHHADVMNLKTTKDGKRDGRLDGDRILVVRAKDVTEPKRLRYLHCAPWTGYIFNEVNLPLGAFHLDVPGARSDLACEGTGIAGAEWIGLPPDGTAWTGMATNQPPLPKNTVRFRKTFSLRGGEVKRARALVCGLGFSELWVNGAPADPGRMLSPCVCNYARRLMVVPYDVTAMVKPGAANTVGIWVSPGYSDDFSIYGWRWLWPKRAILKLDVEFADGAVQTVATDGTWEWTDDTPVTETSVYDGETFDATRCDPDWCRPAGSRAAWRPAAVLPPPKTERTEVQTSPAVHVHETFRPKAIRETDPGVYTVDFGQNLAGVCEIAAQGPKGTRIDPFPIRKAKARDTFVLAGTGGREFFRPRFTYHGFRYVEVRGYPGRLTVDDIAMRAVHADVRYTAGFTSSNPTLNWIFNAAKWTLFSNLLSYPSDCCDRDERTPCRGDSMKSEVSSMRFFDMRSFYRKWLEDTRYDRTGVLTTTGDLVMLPWRMWMWYGDRTPLEERYDNMTGVLRHFLRLYPGYIVGNCGYGDWCHPNNKTWAVYLCEPRAVESAVLVKLLMTIRDAAEALGRKDDAAMWSDHVVKAKKAYQAALYDPATHVYGGGLQVNYLLPLAFGIVPEGERDAVKDKLLDTIKKDGMKLTTGGPGTRHLVEVLCDMGEVDLAFHLLTQPEYPSPEYMRSRGATTMWEQWYYERAMNSHAHMMFTGLGSTLFTCFAGIRAVRPGYAEIEIRPSFPAKLDFVDAWQETPCGRVGVSWKRTGGAVDLKATVPSEMSAVLRLPDGTRRRLVSGENNLTIER